MMTDIKLLIEKLKDAGSDIYWLGNASRGSIERLQELLHTRLPLSLQKFLEEYGGGGIVGEEISGIEDDNPSLDYRGTIYGDTMLSRTDYGLPLNLIVVYLGSDDVVLCIDTNLFTGDECPVVSFDVFKKTTKHLANTFDEFLMDYLELRITRV
ncbi:YobK [Planctopirus limnophila DSM 3776]|uniref:YobK n=1 Tax=Planctopirus limnophila (strain ATCC 43296 / DSM 3776 / IFAM 1008 / Mu 290) TaxID=521674 RepID=D5SSH7_PLAL2|nr:SMI1/KNR4 family protein [Planctopirus limnophila]ADG66725.1 YobK [Planctopirus limnophila DSM 3776]